ncbi:MAG: SpaA isopeptide-forming pilin-related protein [Clostridia bacterium]
MKKGQKVYRQAKYSYSSTTQDVVTFRKFEDKSQSDVENKVVSNEKSIKWMNFTGNLKIIKEDEETGERLKGVKFSVKGPDKTLDKSYTTDENGEINLENIITGEYKVKEVSNSNYGYTVMVEDSVKVKSTKTVVYEAKNKKQTGNLKIIKQDADSEKNLEGVSFKIKKKDENKYIQVKTGDGWKKDITGIVHVDDMQTVDTENEATIFTTNSDGIIEVRNILKGTYYVEEVSVGDIYFGYEVDDDYITWSYTSTANKDNTGSGKGHIATVEVVARASYNTKEPPKEENRNEIVVFKNKRKYIKLSGYAWEDKRVGGKDNKAGNEKCDVEENTESNKEEDKRLANVLVKLYSWEGKLLGQTITDEKGNYVFGTKSMADINGDGIISIVDVTEITRVISSGETNKYTNGLMDINNDGKIDKADIEKLQNIISLNEELIDVKIEDIYNSKTKKAGYIEFTYNGLNYETVSVNVKEENTNKVAEISSNSQNLVDKSIDGTYLDNRTSFNESWAVIENNKKIDSDGNVDTLDYNHNNYASSLSYPGGVTGYNEQKYPIIVKDNTNNNIFNITARTETNTSEDASCKFFGQNKTMEMILSDKEQYIDTIENINLGVKERAQPDLALIKNIYSAKVIVNGYEHTYNYEDRFNKNTGENKNIDEFNPENNEEKTETNVRVKFNQKYGEKSFTRAIYPSDVKETQDKNFSVKVVYKITLKNESGVLYSKINSLVDYFDARYTIEEKGSIGTGYENGEIKDEINYKLDKSYQDAKYRKLIIDCNTKINPNESNRNIYVEYTLTRDSVKDILFDENWDEKTNIEGLENIVEINSYSTYSDKDFTKSYAGIDSDSNPGSTIPGNKDTYEDDTDYAPGLILEVANSREITGTVFEDNAVDPTEGGTNRERLGNGKFDDGEKTISGVQVGLYKEADFEEIKDEDGKIIDMQLESKAKPVGTTTYGGDNKDSTGKDGAFTIKDFAPGEYRIVYFWGDGKYTIEDYKSTIWTSDNKNEKDGNPNTWYRVNTDKRYSDALDNYDTRLKIDRGDTSINKMDSKTPTMVFGVELADDIDNKKTETSGIGKVTFSIENIDFGVIERPRQSIDVTKRAKSMKMTLANGQVIADAKIVEKDGKLQLEQQVKGVIYTEPSDKNNPKNGQIKAEIDNELIQGSKVEIEYEIKVQNNSEIDYDSEKYYCYGEKDVEIVKIKASGVYDYLDNTMIANDENTEWETIKDYNEKVSKPTVIEEYLHKYQSSSTDASGNTEIRIGYEKFEEQYSEAIGNWRIENIITARKKRLADKTILHNANLEGEIAPGEFNMASLTASKILTNTDEIELNNDVEITEVTRTAKTGRKVTPKYTSLYDRGETVTITTPTGENKNYILITIVAISFFVILGTGIVFIKKKILK